MGVNTQMLIKNTDVLQEVTSRKGIHTPPPDTRYRPLKSRGFGF